MDNEQGSNTKLYIDLPNQGATGGPGGESVWALPLGDDLYEIRSTPFFAYGINWGDVVRADSGDPERKPEICEVVKPGGNQTLHIFFTDDLNEESQNSILSSLQHLQLSWERATARYVAIDVHPRADYQSICLKLNDLKQQGILEYETCEARIPGSFDDLPADEDE